MENVESQASAKTLSTAGSRLRQAREAAGLSRADIATQTKIAERHLIAIEEDRFGDLAARTYAVGFSRTYARALGLDEAEIADQVRVQLDAGEMEHTGLVEPSFEPGDPARVPPVRMAWIAAGGVIVVVGLLLAFWGNFLSPEGTLPDLTADKPVATESAAPRQVAPASQAAVNDGPVVMTATADGIWVKVTDASGKQLLQKELAKGESWTVPQDAQGPQLRTGRPDALTFTVGGKTAPALSDKAVIMSGVSLAAADVLARGSTAPTPAATAEARPAPAMPSAAPAPATVQTQAPVAARPAPRVTQGSAAGTAAPATVRAAATVAPKPMATPSRQATATASPRPVATRTMQAPEPVASTTPAAQVVPPTPSPSPNPKPGLQPVSTVSE
jgi:cytoskeletal protein RodZ